MKLGACYNVFDGEELLEASVKSIRSEVDYICVVYQTTSNFGNECNPGLETLLNDLKCRSLIDELVFYQPQHFSDEEKIELVSQSATSEVGGDATLVGNQFFNEITKREIGRRKCKENGCTHFLSVDTDEFYLAHELNRAKAFLQTKNYETTACRMRTFFKEPIYEYVPYDEVNAVPFINKIMDGLVFKLASHGYPILLDPTRRLEASWDTKHTSFYLFPRSVVEMYHMTLVRRSIQKKIDNVSNRGNYDNIESFISSFESWNGPHCGVLHPHPFIGKLFKSISVVPNYFNINIKDCCNYCFKMETMRCGRCKKNKILFFDMSSKGLVQS